MNPQAIPMQSYEPVRMQRLVNCLNFKRPEAHFWKEELHQKSLVAKNTEEENTLENAGF